MKIQKKQNFNIQVFQTISQVSIRWEIVYLLKIIK
jgi:hypothetical protein